ncbi:hypothetical protein KFU94_57030 [Chloroflexi bacterium TSY]|nr:hypothetical protein [Chloroflexi bacterium TSY]
MKTANSYPIPLDCALQMWDFWTAFVLYITSRRASFRSIPIRARFAPQITILFTNSMPD